MSYGQRGSYRRNADIHKVYTTFEETTPECYQPDAVKRAVISPKTNPVENVDNRHEKTVMPTIIGTDLDNLQRVPLNSSAGNMPGYTKLPTLDTGSRDIIYEKCSVCQSSHATMCFLPCQHTVTCESCSKLILSTEERKCILCKQYVESSHDLYTVPH